MQPNIGLHAFNSQFGSCHSSLLDILLPDQIPYSVQEYNWEQMGHGGGLVVSALASCSDDPSSILAGC